MRDKDALMLEQIYETLILEKTYHYSIPKDKKSLLYDFYIISFLNQFDLDQTSPGNKPSGFGDVIKLKTMRRELDENTKDSFIQAKQKVLDYLKPHLLKSVFFAICAEFRHIFTNNESAKLIEFFKKLEGENFIRKYAVTYKSLNTNFSNFVELRNTDRYRRFKDDNRGYLDSYKSVKHSGVNPVKFVKMAEKAFTQLSWGSAYGGNPWGNICKGWVRLYNSNTEDELFVAIDHIYDLQHNTDTVFNKVRKYYDSVTGYKWIKEALNHKANVESPYGLLDKGSPILKPLALRILKSEGYESWESFVNDNTDKKKSDHKTNSSSREKGKLNKGKIRYNGVWHDGVWHDGTWYDGVWHKGTWHKGTWHDGTWNNGVWHDGAWIDGTWIDGTWNNGTWNNGTWHDGAWYKGTWYNGTWLKGIWDNGVWHDGVWHDGTWYNGVWHDGTWLNGWIYDPSKKGNYQQDWVWSGNYIRSPINPTEYFKGGNNLP